MEVLINNNTKLLPLLKKGPLQDIIKELLIQMELLDKQ
jgi:hypothetical protein